MSIRTLIAICVLLTSWSASAGERPLKWETYADCSLVPNPSNDGDSFHVMCDGRERIFRLCFVDCPETSDLVPKRVKEQADVWLTNANNVMAAGHAASRYSLGKLKTPFTVHTAWEDAKGQSSMPRHFAMIEVRGAWLSELLVRTGHARVHGYPRDLPDGAGKWEYRRKLQALEKTARKQGKGVWRYGFKDR